MSYSNGPIEGVNTKTKLIKRQMYGRASFELLRQPDPARIDGPPPEVSQSRYPTVPVPVVVRRCGSGLFSSRGSRHRSSAE
ncbi:hypothetical protein C5E51_36425 [Nocardia nova]|nr:hypothetical protein C5E51_36425 [Nocardia nova]